MKLARRAETIFYCVRGLRLARLLRTFAKSKSMRVIDLTIAVAMTLSS